jgi:hypothetical protein
MLNWHAREQMVAAPVEAVIVAQMEKILAAGIESDSVTDSGEIDCY